MTCGDRCRVMYDWGHTPIIHYVSPSTVYPGLPVTIGVNPYEAGRYANGIDPPINVRIDGVSLDFS